MCTTERTIHFRLVQTFIHKWSSLVISSVKLDLFTGFLLMSTIVVCMHLHTHTKNKRCLPIALEKCGRQAEALRQGDQ